VTTAAATTAAAALPRADIRPAPVWRNYRFELVKLLAQWPVRLALLACWIGPALFVAAISSQSSLPNDTVFGRWMSQTGWAGSLVVLSFACSWILPLLTSLVAGDIFATEDRLGTWRHLLVAVRSPRRIFATKVLASLTIMMLFAAGLTASGIVGGLAAAGNRPLIGLNGQLISPGHAAGAVLLAWASALAPTLAFAGAGLLGSVAFGRSPLGLVIPALLALLTQIVLLLPLPVVVRVALPGYAYIAWHGLFNEPTQIGPLIIGVAVSLVLALASFALAYLLFMRRDFTDLAYDGVGRRVLVGAVLPMAALFAVMVGLTAGVTSPSGSGIDRAKLDRSLQATFANLYRIQTAELHRPAVTDAHLRASAACDKGGSLVPDSGPGNDWRCVITWRLPGVTAVGQTIYQLDVDPDGRYVADGDGPQEVNGYFPIRTSTGNVPNPLWQFDGSINLLTAK
jgi:ABC-2 type transport system permease protein